MKHRPAAEPAITYHCGCDWAPGLPVTACALCWKATCPIHQDYRNHKCPICSGCGFRHPEPLHELSFTRNRRSSWVR